jgi:hypothetical protein
MSVRAAIIISLLTVPLSWEARLTDVLGLLWQPALQTHTDRKMTPEQFHWEGTIAAGRVLEIQSLNGSIFAELSVNNDASVTAVKHGSLDLQQKIEIGLTNSHNGISISASYRQDELHGSGPGRASKTTSESPGREDMGVDFTVRIPWGVRFVAKTVNGDIIVSSLGGPVEAKAMNGDVRLSTSAYAQAQTVNGSVIASLGGTSRKTPIGFDAVRGDVALHLPVTVNSAISARILRGQILSAFPLDTKHGSGNSELQIRTIEGSIRLQRTSQYLALLEDLGWITSTNTAVQRAGLKPQESRVGGCGLRIGGTGSVALTP